MDQDGLQARRRRVLRNMAEFCAAMACAAAVLSVTHVGCPIKFFTGVSCPGCGMTRAWLSLIHGDAQQALRYHPLFWAVPVIMALLVVDPGAKSGWARATVLTIAAAFVAVWLLRLNSPHDALILAGAHHGPDYISVEQPVWLTWLLERFPLV